MSPCHALSQATICSASELCSFRRMLGPRSLTFRLVAADGAVGRGGFTGVYTMRTFGSFDLDVVVDGTPCQIPHRQPQTTGTVVISKCAPGHEQDGTVASRAVFALLSTPILLVAKRLSCTTPTSLLSRTRRLPRGGTFSLSLSRTQSLTISLARCPSNFYRWLWGTTLLNCRHQETCRGVL